MGGNWPAGPALSRVNPLLQRPARNHRCVFVTDQCRSGFTREYDGGCNGERLVETGQQVRPFRG
ncbi:diguanylate phosphodiesterase [Pseudomonas putida]|nr:diguanylate phosphodiesterase [Pseudomonas putida]